jgi:hypothetical protein
MNCTIHFRFEILPSTTQHYVATSTNLAGKSEKWKLINDSGYRSYSSIVNPDIVEYESISLDIDRTIDRFNRGDTKLYVDTEIIGIGNKRI